MLNELETKPVLPAVLHTQKTELMSALIECALPTFLLITVMLILCVFKFTEFGTSAPAVRA